MNPINDMHDMIEENARLERVLLLQKQHIAELVKWEAVFGHLGTPDEVGNEWDRLKDRLEMAENVVVEAYRRGYATAQEEIDKDHNVLLDRISKLERALYLMAKNYKSVPYAQWPAEMHFANEVLEKSK